MENYNKIAEELEKFGFKKEENDMFVFDNVTYNNMFINGRQFQQPQHNYIRLQYAGEGCIMDENCCDSDMDNNSTPFSQFDILDENMEIISTICVYDIDDIKFFLNLT
jgi:hypothetical protein